jgi:hypothetical protein
MVIIIAQHILVSSLQRCRYQAPGILSIFTTQQQQQHLVAKKQLQNNIVLSSFTLHNNILYNSFLLVMLAANDNSSSSPVGMLQPRYYDRVLLCARVFLRTNRLLHQNIVSFPIQTKKYLSCYPPFPAQSIMTGCWAVVATRGVIVFTRLLLFSLGVQTTIRLIVS